MRLGIMQPYFFPYLGYFSLIAATDKWIFFDTPQYIRHGWINRNRILKPSKDDWQYITAPLEKHSRDTCIKDVVLKNNGWQKKVLGQIAHYKNKAPFYHQVKDLLRQIIDVNEGQISLSKLNASAINIICNYCDIPIDYKIFSEMDLIIGPVNAPDEWALEISKSLEADIYINPTGGMDFFNPEKYKQSGIELRFLKNSLTPYTQPNEQFIPGLSIIDVLMFCSSNETRIKINDYELITND